MHLGGALKHLSTIMFPPVCCSSCQSVLEMWLFFGTGKIRLLQFPKYGEILLNSMIIWRNYVRRSRNCRRKPIVKGANVLFVGGHKTLGSLLREKVGCTNIFVFCGSGMDEHVTSVRARQNGGSMQAVNLTYTESVVCVLFQLTRSCSHHFTLSLDLWSTVSKLWIAR